MKRLVLLLAGMSLCIYVSCNLSSTSDPSDDSERTLVWSDEFSGTSLDLDDWTYELGVGDAGWGNNELETYMGGDANLTVKDGILDIEARKESTGKITSARIITKGKQEFRYGRLEARIKCSEGTGTWPAFWMLGSNSDTAEWPRCGEIDIMEHANSDKFVYTTLHWNAKGSGTDAEKSEAAYGEKSHNNNYTKIPILDVTDWHIYAIDWGRSKIDWYVDDIKIFSMGIGDASNGTDCFNNSFYFVINLAIGGNFVGNPEKSSLSIKDSPAHLYVDYVRVYQ